MKKKQTFTLSELAISQLEKMAKTQQISKSTLVALAIAEKYNREEEKNA